MKNFKIYIIIILVCVIFTLYIFEGYVRITSSNKISDIEHNTSLKEKIYKEKTGKQYDTRTNLQVIEYYKKKGKNVILSFLPHNLRGSTDLDLFPLSGPSNSKIIYCNENGYYSIIDSDRYGFNNPDEEWNKSEIEYLLVGDSFTFGDCVNRPDDISSVLRNLSNKAVLNLGYEGNGPLMEYAALREYFPKHNKVKNILWLYYEGNDNYELTLELKNEILKRYFDDINYSQDLKKKQKYVDLITKISIEKVREKIKQSNNQTKSNKEEKISSKITKFLKLKKTRSGLRENPKPRSQFNEILKFTLQFANQKNSNFYFVYLPEYGRYKLSNYKQRNYKKVKKILKKLNIPLIDIHKEVFENEENPLKLFPFELGGHYNVEGYQKVAEAIYRWTQK